MKILKLQHLAIAFFWLITFSTMRTGRRRRLVRMNSNYITELFLESLKITTVTTQNNTEERKRPI